MNCQVCGIGGIEYHEIGDDCLKCPECGQCYLRLPSGELKPFRHLGEFGKDKLLDELKGVIYAERRGDD